MSNGGFGLWRVAVVGEQEEALGRVLSRIREELDGGWFRSHPASWLLGQVVENGDVVSSRSAVAMALGALLECGSLEMVEAYPLADGESPGTLEICQNCGLVQPEGYPSEIEDYHQRVGPGEIAPSGVCRACGCLCHPLGAIASHEVVSTGAEPTSLGTLWWNADHIQEARAWATSFLARGAEDVVLKPERDSERVTVLITLDRSRANEIMGYEIENEEWLVLE